MREGQRVRKEQVPMWAEVAAYLEISTGYLRDLRKRADAPKEPDKNAWLEYKLAKGINGDGAPSGDRAKLLAEQTRKTKAEADMREMDRDAKAMRTVDRAEVDRLLALISQGARSILYQLMEDELPPAIAGLDVVECRIRLRHGADRVCDHITSHVRRWAEQAAQAEQVDATLSPLPSTSSPHPSSQGDGLSAPEQFASQSNPKGDLPCRS